MPGRRGTGFDHATAIREYLAAIAGRPNLTDAHERLGVVLFHVAMLEESAAHSLQALAINPDARRERSTSGCCPVSPRTLPGGTGDFDCLPSGNRRSGAVIRSRCACLRLGDLDGAAQAAERGARLFTGDPGSHSLRGLIAARRGDATEARRQIELTVRHQSDRQRFTEVPIKTASSGHYHHAQYDIACI